MSDVTRPFGRTLTAMITPFSADGSLDVTGAQELATYLVDRQRCDGLVLNGTTGESPTTSDAEKERLVAAVVEAVGDRASVVAGVGTHNTEHTMSLAAAAEKAGADGLLVVTPYYSKPPQEFLRRHFTTVADAAGVPVMLYDVPHRTAAPIATETLLALADHPNIVAVKDAKDDLEAAVQVLAATDLALYCGTDDLSLACYAIGEVGVVSMTGHVVGARTAAMFDAVDAGDMAEARRINFDLLPAGRAVTRRTNAVAALKAMLAARGLPSGSPRPPLYDADEGVCAAIEADLAEIEAIR